MMRSTVVLAVVISLVLATQSVASAQIVCEDFTGDSASYPGAYRSSPFDVTLGTFPYDGLIKIENAQDFWIQAYPAGEESVYVPGSPAAFVLYPLLGDGVSLPTYFSMWLLAGADDAVITVYDEHDNLLDSYTVVHSSAETVVFDGVGEIARVEVDGGNNETWIDDLCLAP